MCVCVCMCVRVYISICICHAHTHAHLRTHRCRTFWGAVTATWTAYLAIFYSLIIILDTQTHTGAEHFGRLAPRLQPIVWRFSFKTKTHTTGAEHFGGLAP
jgi:hypothetical protein